MGRSKERSNRCAQCEARAGSPCMDDAGRVMSQNHPERQSAPPPRLQPSISARRRQKSRQSNDSAYRRALGLTEDETLPSQLGTQASAGSARGGRGASRKGAGKHT
jgi:hypothetical protein